ncbi:hypothetical protein A6R68_18001, partial [Neotoma lepida]
KSPVKCHDNTLDLGRWLEAISHFTAPITLYGSIVIRYDFVELLDGSRLIAREQRNLVESERAGRQARSVSLHEAGFIQYLDSGIWHLAFYNDGKNPEPSLWWNAPEIAMEMENVFLELAIVFQGFWVRIVQEKYVQWTAAHTVFAWEALVAVKKAGPAQHELGSKKIHHGKIEIT